MHDPIVQIVLAVVIIGAISWIVTKIKGPPNQSQEGRSEWP